MSKKGIFLLFFNSDKVAEMSGRTVQEVQKINYTKI
jgi:hypothetical protein